MDLKNGVIVCLFIFFLVIPLAIAYTADSRTAIDSTLGHSIYIADSRITINSTLDDDSGVTAPPSDSCTYTSGNWVVDCADDCSITTPVDLGGNNITITGTGVFNSNATITNYDIFRIEGTDSLNICSVKFIK